MNAALKSHGGSQAYAPKTSLSAGATSGAATPEDSIKNLNGKTDACDADAAGRCSPAPGHARNGGGVGPATWGAWPRRKTPSKISTRRPMRATLTRRAVARLRPATRVMEALSLRLTRRVLIRRRLMSVQVGR